MDSHCESTLTLQLDGTKRWRLSWPPNVPDGSFARDGTYGDGRPYSIKGGWKPGFSFNLSKGEVLLIPPAFVHESLNVEPEGCSPSLTFQFADPPASSMFRRLWPRMRRTGDFNECWDRVAAFATLAPDGRAKSQLKALGLLPPGQLLDRSPDEILDDAVKAVSKSWANVLRAHDRSGDGRLTDEADNLGGGLGFHDDNIDGEITQEEFARGLADWLNVEIATLREKTSKPKQLQKLEL
ncbi:unnamed protein product [Prorocentrum cordatum]|uniref:JmjC domain-containing protein n=1 Tax=Prorocentrum cordatum TaxID=2364126 RepID=A0ABN9PWV7_9DINO|nr:unnamed protein product [Polarella glacialis]